MTGARHDGRADITGEREWRREEAHPAGVPGRGFRVPWLPLAGAAATVAAAATLVAGIGETVGDRPAGRLLPLQAASPSRSAEPSPPPVYAEPPEPARTPARSPEPTPERTPEPTADPPATRIQEALLQLRISVIRGVQVGDVRVDVGRDLVFVIERLVRRPGVPLARRRQDVACLHRTIAVRTRQGTIRNPRAVEFHLILDSADQPGRCT